MQIIGLWNIFQAKNVNMCQFILGLKVANDSYVIEFEKSQKSGVH
jgi:hypothetical protein